jgi:acyl carrier protein
LPDGRIEFLGRVDLQVKIRGFRIELGEIETAISRHPAVRQVVVAAAEDKPGLKRLVAYLAPEGSIESLPSPGDLRHFLLSALPDYMIPSIFMTLESLPLTPNGKINRLALPKPQISRDALSEAYVAPRTPIEADLTKIWANLLNVEQVGVEDDFFALGGHSLLATQLVSRIRDTFDLELPLQKMFEAPSVAGLALLIANEKAQEVESNRLEAILAELDGLSDEEVQALLGPDN